MARPDRVQLGQPRAIPVHGEPVRARTAFKPDRRDLGTSEREGGEDDRWSPPVISFLGTKGPVGLLRRLEARQGSRTAGMEPALSRRSGCGGEVSHPVFVTLSYDYDFKDLDH